MVEEKNKSYRLFKVAKELNVGITTLADFLKAKGHPVGSDLNEKISSDMYDLLLKEYAPDLKLKERAEQLKVLTKEVPKPALKPGDKAAEEPEFRGPSLSANDLRHNLVAPKVVEKVAEKPVAKPEPLEPEALPVVAEEPVAPMVAQAEAEPEPAKQGLKVVGKIDLEQFGKKKGKAKVEPTAQAQLELEPVVAVVPEPVAEVVAEPVAAIEAAEEPEEVIRAKDNAPKLEGLKVVGRIELPGKVQPPRQRTRTDDDRPRDSTNGTNNPTPNAQPPLTEGERLKRKRKTTPQLPDAGTTGGAKKPGSTGGGSRNAPPRRNDREPASPQNVQDNIRNTLSQMNNGARRFRQRNRRDKRDIMAARRDQVEQDRLANSNVLEVTEFLTANELANLMDVSVNQVIQKCLELGLFVSINQRIDADVISLIAEEFGFQVNFISLDESFEEEEEEEEDDALEPRAPIVTVMGHVDHGKTSLLDHIRSENVIAGEAGGITQHIGAYEVKLANGREITFLDTPGHEAFTAMRARGAQVTDIAIIVIAADDQVMPQTREAINHAQAAGVKMVFAINKIDKQGALPEKIKEQLAQMNLLVEDWGGTYQSQEISAKSGFGINELLDKVLLEADLLDLKANPGRMARGTVIEAQLDKGRGVVATILVQTGTLKQGDIVLVNSHFGRVKAMTDERQRRLKEAGPSTPVQILGLDGMPQAGDKFLVMESERDAREMASRRQQLLREQTIRMQKHITLEEIARRSAVGDFQELNIIVKGDVDGSVEALSDSLLKLSTGEVAVNIIMKGVGQISESDVLLASASDAIVIGFQVRPSSGARKLAQAEQIDIRMYSVIYDAINEIKTALEGLLAPKVEEEVTGVAEVREVFRITKVGTVAGCMVTEGKINRANPIRLIRDGVVVFTGKTSALKRFKDDVREVAEGYECGISVENYNDIRTGDLLECFTSVQVKRTLA